MTNLLPTIVPKSDQLNADDLIGRSLTIKVSKIALSGDADQPVAVHYEGDGGKPYKPCKSMRRVMVQVWGVDGNVFIGRRMTLYRDDTVRFGGQDVGGIRISHMSDIDKPVTMALTATRANRKPFTVKPLGPEKPSERADVAPVDLDGMLAEGRKAALQGELSLQAWWKGLTAAQKVAVKPTLDAELKPLAKGEIAEAEPPYGDETPEPSFGDDGANSSAPAPLRRSAAELASMIDGLRTGRDLMQEQAIPEDLPPQALAAHDALMDAMDTADSMDALDEVWNAEGDLKAQLAVHAPNRFKALQDHYNGRLEAMS